MKRKAESAKFESEILSDAMIAEIAEAFKAANDDAAIVAAFHVAKPIKSDWLPALLAEMKRANDLLEAANGVH